jgi:cyclophilin family peptidyl-prolyl cis-trans isomerase
MKTLLILAAAAAATPAPKPALAPSEVVAAAPSSDWVAIAASDLLVMDLANGKRVVIQLMPPPFSQGWVGNIRKLAAARWWDGTSINRVQDNYVVQWGDPNGDPTPAQPFDSVEQIMQAVQKAFKTLPTGLVKVPQSEYLLIDPRQFPIRVVMKRAAPKDSYSDFATPLLGWPLAFGKDGVWPVHCYGMVGVGRDMPPDTGTGAELYTVIGHAPRHLDRNIALVGRVISGIENLSSLPRGTGALGFYEKPEERTRITSIRIGSDVAGLPRFEYLSTESASFASYADARANRRDPFFIVPAGGADICNIPVPVRMAK